MLKVAIQTVVAVLVYVIVTGQVRKPTGLLGRAFARGFNTSHSAMTDWALALIQFRKTDAILDVGCGGGRTVQKLATLAPQGTVTGVDYAEASVATSRQVNAAMIAAGRVKIEHASVAALPFSDQTFDVVTAVETHYYWPDLVANTREIFRVMKPGGTVALIAEAYKGMRFSAAFGIAMRIVRARFISAAEHREFLTAAGFTDVRTVEGPNREWICALACKPA